MKLSEIVHLKNLTVDPTVYPRFDVFFKTLNEFMYYIYTHSVRVHDIEPDLSNTVADLKQNVVKFEDKILFFREKLNSAIKALEPDYYANSKVLYENDMAGATNEHVLNRKLAIDDESYELLKGHLKYYVDWRLPAMILRPGLETFIEDLVALDPLYLVDHNQQLLAPAVQRFTPEYQRRLRTYIVDERLSDNILKDLPDNQFGLVFAYNYFNFKSIDVIVRYLQEIFEKLRSGGTLVMTYNECDHHHGIELFERGFMCYTPGKTIKEHAEKIGFETTFHHSGLADLTWFEFKRPGDIETLRGGQTLAKVVPK